MSAGALVGTDTATAAKPPLTVEFSVRLSDRSYESTLSVPVGAPETHWRPVVEAWLKLMEASLVAVK